MISSYDLLFGGFGRKQGPWFKTELKSNKNDDPRGESGFGIIGMSLGESFDHNVVNKEKRNLERCRTTKGHTYFKFRIWPFLAEEQMHDLNKMKWKGIGGEYILVSESFTF